MSKKKLSDASLASLVSATLKDKPYDLNMAVNTLSLVEKLKNKVKEDFQAIEDIEEELAGVSKASTLIENLDSIVMSLREVDNKINSLYNYLKPKN